MTQEYETDEVISLDLTAIFADPKMKKWIKRLEKPIKLLTKISVLDVYLNRIDKDSSPESTWEKWLKHLQVRFLEADNSPGVIPKTGPVIFTSNHPFGMLDGFGLTATIKSIRPDVKIMTNHSLQPVTGLSDDIIGVDPYEKNSSKKANLAPVRTALHWLKQGGAMVVFPGGDVSTYNSEKDCIVDPPWNPIIGRIAAGAKADIVPLFIHGTNSKLFYRLRHMNERIASFMLARECLKKRGNTILYSVGEKISKETIQAMKTGEVVINYARKKTYELAGKTDV
jgi:putative hemolysin